MSVLLVTGTDTGIGKTFVACARPSLPRSPPAPKGSPSTSLAWRP